MKLRVLMYIGRLRSHSSIKPQCKQNKASVEASDSDSWVPENTYPPSPAPQPLTYGSALNILKLFGDNLYQFPQSFFGYHSVRGPSKQWV